jgi:NADPH-dependent sulfite reductase flavoprotein alpha-component
LQWPVPPEDAPGGTEASHPIRYLNDGVSQDLFVDDTGRRPRLAFPTPSRRATFHPRPHMDAAELPDDNYPLVLNTGRLQHQWHTMTKTGKVDKLNKLDSGPFVEIHPDDAAAKDIVDGRSVELTSRRGRAILPALVTDRVRPGNLWVPFHWNDEYGPCLTINALTNGAVDPDSLQPEFKVCAVSLRPVPVELPAPSSGPTVAALGLTDRVPTITDDEKTYLSGFFAGLVDGSPGLPVLPAGAPIRPAVRLWVDGLLAGKHSRAGLAPTAKEHPPAPASGHGPLVMWASQTGNAEDYAARVAQQLGTDAQLRTMNDCQMSDLACASDIVIVTSTFGDGGPPDNGAVFWDRLDSPDAPSLDGVRYAVLGIGDRSYDNFCGYAKSLDARLANLGATKLLERADCEAYENEPMAAWAESVTALIRGTQHAGQAGSHADTTAQIAEPFTRSMPVTAPLCRNSRLTPSTAAKEVRHFGFDISEHKITYATGDSLGVCAVNSEFAVETWLALTGLRGTTLVEVDGVEVELYAALTSSYDICKVTPNLLAFVAEHCDDPAAARTLQAPPADLGTWLHNRNGLDIVRELRVRADPAQWQQALARLAPRQFSICSSPLVSPSEVQLTVSVVRYPGSDGGPRGGVASTFLADAADGTRVPVFLQRSPHFRPPSESSIPMVMVGPGVGIAPFRGFLQERRALGHEGPNWLFFGGQHMSENFYYRDYLTDMVIDGLLTHLDVAFSRDQRQRIYVQHKMADMGAELWRWLEDGAYFYVCGDARMAKDVDTTLTWIIRRHGWRSEDGALEYKADLIGAKRYVREVF